MALIRWQPRESFAIQREIDDLVSKFWGDVNTWHGTGLVPPRGCSGIRSRIYRSRRIARAEQG